MIETFIAYAINQNHSTEEVVLEFIKLIKMPSIKNDEAWLALKNNRVDAYQAAKILFFQALVKKKESSDKVIVNSLCTMLMEFPDRLEELVEIVRNQRPSAAELLCNEIHSHIDINTFKSLCEDTVATDETIKKSLYTICKQDMTKVESYFAVVKKLRPSVYDAILKDCSK